VSAVGGDVGLGDLAPEHFVDPGGVGIRIIGMKIAVTTSMMNSVRCELELSQTVSELFGSTVEGRMKGNIVSPTVEITR
jgi:hypothetical protein